MQCPFTGIGMSVAPSSCQKMGCGMDGEFCYLERQESAQGLREDDGFPAPSGNSHRDLDRIEKHLMETDRNGPISRDLEISAMDRENPHRVETRLPDLTPDYSQAPPQVEALAGYVPVDYVTHKDGTRHPMLYGRDGVPWPKPDHVKDPESYAAWLAENTDRARLIEQRFGKAAKSVLTGGGRRVEITDAGSAVLQRHDVIKQGWPMLSAAEVQRNAANRHWENQKTVIPDPVQTAEHYLRRIYWTLVWLATVSMIIACGLIWSHT